MLFTVESNITLEVVFTEVILSGGGGGGAGGLNLPLPVHFTPGSRPIFVASLALYAFSMATAQC